MAAIKFKVKGSFLKTHKYFESLLKVTNMTELDKYGKAGVEALRKATPKDTGKTADAWDYRVEKEKGLSKIIWFNTNENNGVNIAVILQYGHGTKNGGYVRGIDYINPAMQPIFQEIADKAWNEITNKS